MIRIGVIGVGRIAQTMHLPYLTGTEGGGVSGIEVEAVCDVIGDLAKAMAKRFNVTKVYTDHREMLQDPRIDAVAVITRLHTQFCLDAMNAGKYVFTEKPLCYSLKEVDLLAEAERKNKVLLQLGYMKRYDSGYPIAQEEFGKMKNIGLIRVHKYLPYFGLFYYEGEMLRQTRFPFPEQLARESAEEEKCLITDQIGKASSEEIDAYRYLVAVFGHTMDVLIGIFGMPKRVLCTDIKDNGRFLTSLVDYGNTDCVIECGSRGSPRWDEYIVAYSPERNVEAIIAHSHLKNRPITVRVQEGGEKIVETTIQGSQETAFRREWDAFVRFIEKKERPYTGIENGRNVIRFSSAIIECHQQKSPVEIK